jgi:hypothetical protein
MKTFKEISARSRQHFIVVLFYWFAFICPPFKLFFKEENKIWQQLGKKLKLYIAKRSFQIINFF